MFVPVQFKLLTGVDVSNTMTVSAFSFEWIQAELTDCCTYLGYTTAQNYITHIASCKYVHLH